MGEYICSGIVLDTNKKDIKLPTTVRILVDSSYEKVETALEDMYEVPVKGIRTIRRVGTLL